MDNKHKFHIGEKCKVIKNYLSPEYIDQTVEILDIFSRNNGRYFYKIKVDEFEGIASENCLTLIEKECQRLI